MRPRRHRALLRGPSTSPLDRRGGRVVPSTESYWFPAKRYGWGWGPPTAWQGWVVIVAWSAALFEGLFILRHERYHLASRVVFVLMMSVALTLVCYWKGEPTKWRSGGPRA